MKTLSKFITLLLCLELIVSPIAPNLSMVANTAYAEDCPTGFQFDSTLNRCLTKTETANVMNATMACGDDVQCYKENAQKALQDKVNAGDAPERKKDMGFVSKVAGIAAIAGPVTYAVMGMSKSNAKCASPAFYGMIAGALAVVVGDNLANLQHKKRLKAIKKEWGEIVNPEQANGDKDKERQTSIEAQSQAFEMLARAEDSLASAAKMKKNFFMVASLAYGVTAALSAMEIMTNKKLKVAAVNASRAAVTASAGIDPANMTSITTASAKVAIAAGKAEANENALVPGPVGAEGKAQAAQVEIMTAKTQILSAQQSIIAGQTAAAAATPVSAPLTAAYAKSVPAVATAVAAVQSWETHTRTITCIPTGTATTYNEQSSPGIYSYYINGPKLDIRQEIMFLHNMKHSTDLASFIMIQKNMEGNIESPFTEYQAYKEVFGKYSEDKTVFELIKSTTLAVMNSLNPISTAYASEEVQFEATESASSDSIRSSDNNNVTGQASASSSSVKTNAAKAFKEDEGKGIDLLSIGIGVGAGVLLAVKSEIGRKLITSTGRLVFSGVMAGMTLMMSQHAGSQAEASTKRAELLRKMKDEFNTASGAVYACKSEDRNDPGKPNCYCYTAENGRNPNRSNSQICQKLWAGLPSDIQALASSTSSNKVCVNQNQQADATCACRSTNTCMKVKLNGVSGLNPGSMSILNGAITPLNRIADGTIDGANIDGASLASNAAKVNALNKELEKNPDVAKAKNSKAALELKKSLERGAASLGSGGGFLGSSGSSSMPSNPGQAARMLEKELEEATAPTVGGGNVADFTPASVPDEQLEFGLTGDQLAAQEGQIAELMKEDLDYGGNDINQGSKTNIFDVLSNRYQRSGMRRLFDEKGVTKPDAAAKTDITQ